MSGTMNPISLNPPSSGGGYGGGMPGPYSLGGGYGYMNPAMLTPQQRMNMYAMQLMSGGNSQPQRSGWGATSNAFSPILGAAMMNWGGGQNTPPTAGLGGGAAGVPGGYRGLY